MLSAGHQHVPQLDELFTGDLGMIGEIQRGADDVQLPAQQGRNQRVDDAARQPDPDLRPLAAELRENRRQDARGPHGPGSDIDRAFVAALEGLDFDDGVAILQFHQARAARQDFAETRGDAPGRQPFEELNPQHLLELMNALRKGGLTDVEFSRGGGEALVLDDREKMAQQPRMHVVPPACAFKPISAPQSPISITEFYGFGNLYYLTQGRWVASLDSSMRCLKHFGACRATDDTAQCKQCGHGVRHLRPHRAYHLARSPSAGPYAISAA